MNFIEKIVEKYNGHYTEEIRKGIYSPAGKLVYQPQKGIINVDGSKILIAFNDTEGTMPTDPVRIILILKHDYEIKLSIFPAINFDYITDFIFQPRNLKVPKALKKQFSFRGNKAILQQLVNDQAFNDAILYEQFYISLKKDNPKNLILTPAYGIDSLEHFDKMVLILKRIEVFIKNKNT